MARSESTQQEDTAELNSTNLRESLILPWRSETRIAFRFFFLYFGLYNFPFPLGWLPGTQSFYQQYASIWHRIVPWVGAHCLRLRQPIKTFTNGSGDTTYDYILILCFFLIAVIGTGIWTKLDRQRFEYCALNSAFRVWIRMLLAGTMLLFGSVKVFQVQFPQPSLARLMETYGNSSPMGLMFTFMGASRGYSAFAGSMEMIAGLLLLFPTFTTLAAMLSAAIMVNVLALNLSYDVPVKLYSFHVLAMALLLLSPDCRRIGTFLLESASARPPFRSRRYGSLFLVPQLAFGVYIACNGLYQAYRVDGHSEPKPPYYGIWAVQDMGGGNPALPVDGKQMRYIFFDTFDSFGMQSEDGSTSLFHMQFSNDAKVLKLTSLEDGSLGEFWVQRTAPDLILLDGRLKGFPMHLKIRHLDRSFLLTSRGFHWTNETPYNK